MVSACALYNECWCSNWSSVKVEDNTFSYYTRYGNWFCKTRGQQLNEHDLCVLLEKAECKNISLKTLLLIIHAQYNNSITVDANMNCTTMGEVLQRYDVIGNSAVLDSYTHIVTHGHVDFLHRLDALYDRKCLIRPPLTCRGIFNIAVSKLKQYMLDVDYVDNTAFILLSKFDCGVKGDKLHDTLKNLYENILLGNCVKCTKTWKVDKAGIVAEFEYQGGGIQGFDGCGDNEKFWLGFNGKGKKCNDIRFTNKFKVIVKCKEGYICFLNVYPVFDASGKPIQDIMNCRTNKYGTLYGSIITLVNKLLKSDITGLEHTLVTEACIEILRDAIDAKDNTNDQ